MSESTVAYRYAKSLIGLAEEKKVVGQVYDDMVFFKQTADDNRDLMLALRSPVVRHDKKMGVLEGIFKGRVSDVTYTIFEIITKKNREAIIYSIADEFIKLYDLREGIQKATVTTAVALTDVLRQKFTALVADATKMKVVLEEKIDTDLIGGYVIRVNDKQIDASVKSRLSALKLEFLQ